MCSPYCYIYIKSKAEEHIASSLTDKGFQPLTQNSVSLKLLSKSKKTKMFARKAAIALRDKKRQEHIHTLFTSPKDVNTLVKLGKLYFEEKKYHFALDLSRRAKRSGHNEAATWKICGDCHVEIWKERPLVSKKHLLYALSCYRQALKSIMFSSKPRFLVSVADVYTMYGSFPGALAVLSQIIQNFPSFQNLHCVTHRAAVVLFQIERYEDSLRYLKHVLQRPPESYGRK